METSYEGVPMRSRLEAEVASLVDWMGHDWEYEPQSFTLKGGVHYQPDFWVPALDLWVEPRGYDKEKGRLQIELFSKLVERRYEDYLVIGPDRAEFHGRWMWGNPDDPTYETVSGHNLGLANCRGCGDRFLYSWSGGYACRSCGEYDGDHHMGRSYDLSYASGRILIDDRPLWRVVVDDTDPDSVFTESYEAS